jgi:hypothetical protein
MVMHFQKGETSESDAITRTLPIASDPELYSHGPGRDFCNAHVTGGNSVV